MASPEQYQLFGKHGVGGATLGKTYFLLKSGHLLFFSFLVKSWENAGISIMSKEDIVLCLLSFTRNNLSKCYKEATMENAIINKFNAVCAARLEAKGIDTEDMSPVEVRVTYAKVDPSSFIQDREDCGIKVENGKVVIGK